MVFAFMENNEGAPIAMASFGDMYEAADYLADWPGVARVYQEDSFGKLVLLMSFLSTEEGVS